MTMNGNVILVTDDTFEQEVIHSDIPTLVDFWATWCGPCKMFAPVFEETANQYVGKIKFVKANVDDTRETAQKYGILSVPTLILFKDGKITLSKPGALSSNQLQSLLDENIE